MIHQLAAAALLLVQAPPAERPCITHQEAADMAVALLPFLVDAATLRCRGRLAPDAFLNSGAAEWSARLRQDGAARRDSAFRGIAKLGGAAPPSGAGGETAFQFVAQMMTAGLTARIRPEDCEQVDTIARSLAPLPTDNLANLIVAGLDLGMSRNAAANEEEEADDPDPDAGEEWAGPPICRT